MWRFRFAHVEDAVQCCFAVGKDAIEEPSY